LSTIDDGLFLVRILVARLFIITSEPGDDSIFEGLAISLLQVSVQRCWTVCIFVFARTRLLTFRWWRVVGGERTFSTGGVEDCGEKLFVLNASVAANSDKRLRTSCYRAIIDRVDVCQYRYSGSRSVAAGIVERVVRYGSRDDEDSGVCR